MKKALSIQLEKLLEKNDLTKAEMALRMKTSRAAVDRLLDAENPSVTLSTLGNAARALGRKIKIEFRPGIISVTQQLVHNVISGIEAYWFFQFVTARKIWFKHLGFDLRGKCRIRCCDVFLFGKAQTPLIQIR